MGPLLAGGGGGRGGIRSRKFSILLRSVPGVSFQSTWSCSIFPFFFTIKYPCYLMFNTSKPSFRALQHLKSVERGERYVRCSLFQPFAMSPTQPFLSRRAKILPKGRGGALRDETKMAAREGTLCKGWAQLPRLNSWSLLCFLVG